MLFTLLQDQARFHSVFRGVADREFEKRKVEGKLRTRSQQA